VEKVEKYILYLITFFSENLVFMRYVEKECRAVKAADNNVANAHCMLDN